MSEIKEYGVTAIVYFYVDAFDKDDARAKARRLLLDSEIELSELLEVESV